MTTFAELTTTRVGGPIAEVVTASTDDEVIAALSADAVVLGGGSNVIAADSPFNGRVVRIATTGIEVQRDGDRVLVEVAAGEPWDDLVAFTVEQGWSGIDGLVLDSAGTSAVRYADLARALGVALDGRAPASRVRETVLDLRRAKGMVLDPSDPDTRSTGSFFTNPIVDADVASALDGCPRYPSDRGVKVSAAWLIENAGIERGYSRDGRVRVSTKHTLALANAGGGTADDVLALAREIRDRVQAAFGITLVPEPVLLGCSL